MGKSKTRNDKPTGLSIGIKDCFVVIDYTTTDGKPEHFLLTGSQARSLAYKLLLTAEMADAEG